MEYSVEHLKELNVAVLGDENNQIVTTVRNIKAGEDICVDIHDGKIYAQVRSLEEV